MSAELELGIDAGDEPAGGRDDMTTEDATYRAEALLDELNEVGINPTSLESGFALPLVMALGEWVEIGRFADRRLDDLLFNEWRPGEPWNFARFVQAARYAPYNPDC